MIVLILFQNISTTIVRDKTNMFKGFSEEHRADNVSDTDRNRFRHVD